jgi:hypothetical protein
MSRVIWYRSRQLTVGFWIWLVLFLATVYFNVKMSQNNGHSEGALNVLSLIPAFYLLLYWLVNFCYSLFLFGKLKDGSRFSVFPLFLVLQIILIAAIQRTDLREFLKEVWNQKFYFAWPFLYSVVLYLATVFLFRKMRHYEDEEKGDERAES